jgi:hypothetical protein
VFSYPQHANACPLFQVPPDFFPPVKGVLPAHLVGYEYDAISSDFPIPQGDHSISSSPVISLDGVRSTSNSTIYTAASGARVFASGSMQWSWGLDSYAASDNPHPNYVNLKIQLITLNLFHNFLRQRKAMKKVVATTSRGATSNAI